jgi:hypothetical protein
MTQSSGTADVDNGLTGVGSGYVDPSGGGASLFGSPFGGGMSLPLLYMAAAAGQAATPSRLPVPFGSVLGNVAGGLAQGIGASQEQALRNQQIQQATLQNLAMGQRFKFLQDAFNRTGVFAPGGGGGAASGGLLGPSGSSGSSVAPSGGGLLGDGSTAPTPTGGLLASGSAAPPVAASGGGGAGGGGGAPSGMVNGIPADMYRDAVIADFMVPGGGKVFLDKMLTGPTDLQRAYSYARSLPPGQERDIAMMGVYKAAGLSNNENVRGGSFVLQRDANGNLRPVFFAPKVPEGAAPTANGGIAPLPGATGTIAALSRAQASGPATFKPLYAYDTAGNQLIYPSTVLGGVAGGAGGAAGGSAGPAPDFSGAKLSAPPPQIPLAFKSAVSGNSSLPPAVQAAITPPGSPQAQPQAAAGNGAPR